MPHSELFGDVWMSVLKILWNLSAGFFLFSFWISLSRQHVAAFSSVELPPVLKVCWSWVETVTDDSDWPPEKMLYSSLIGKTEAWNKYKETVSQSRWTFLTVSVIIGFSPPLHDFLLLSLFLTFFKDNPGKKKKKGVGLYRQHCPLKSVPVPFHSPPLASERHFLSFPVLSAHVKQLLTLFPPTVRWFQSAGVQKLLLNTQYDTSVHLFSMQHYAAAALCKLPH